MSDQGRSKMVLQLLAIVGYFIIMVATVSVLVSHNASFSIGLLFGSILIIISKLLWQVEQELELKPSQMVASLHLLWTIFAALTWAYLTWAQKDQSLLFWCNIFVHAAYLAWSNRIILLQPKQGESVLSAAAHSLKYLVLVFGQPILLALVLGGMNQLMLIFTLSNIVFLILAFRICEDLPPQTSLSPLILVARVGLPAAATLFSLFFPVTSSAFLVGWITLNYILQTALFCLVISYPVETTS